MKVWQLIDVLSKANPNMNVVIDGDGINPNTIEGVEVIFDSDVVLVGDGKFKIKGGKENE